MTEHPPRRRITRRRFFKTALVAAAGAAGYAHFIEPQLVQFERLTVTIAGLPAALDGYTIGVLADMHAGGFTRSDWVADVCRRWGAATWRASARRPPAGSTSAVASA